MHPLSPYFAITILAIACFSGVVLRGIEKNKIDTNRYEAIDGLRGFLAIFVFIHHSAIWFDYLHSGTWRTPDSHLYTHLGQTSVSLFFMISAFLFVSKLINHNSLSFDWKGFFKSRFYRIAPLYYFSLLVIIGLAMSQTSWKISTSDSDLFYSVMHWLFFTITGQPDINGFENTFIINAGVAWSLTYEWLLYFGLPSVSLLMLKKRPSVVYLLCSLSFILVMAKFGHIRLEHLLSFVGGSIAPFILKYKTNSINWNTPLISVFMLLCLFGIGFFESTTNILCKLLITVFFTLVALGNNMFGILKNKTLKLLGDISYSTYLLHGLILFISFRYVIGTETITAYSELEYSLVIFVLTPVLVGISYLSYLYIEKPFIAFGKRK